jgi:hypothetical protein
MLKANGIVPATEQYKRSADTQPEAEGVKQEIVEIEDDDEEKIRALEVCLCTSFETFVT